MKKKILVTLAVVACALLLVAGSIVGTLAYLTSTASVTNTFTVGDVKITMTESKVDKYGVKVTGADRVDENEYKLIPAHTYTKDPTIYVEAKSEKCYVFVKVENGISAIEVAEDDGDTIAEQMIANGWENYSGNVWYYNADGVNTVDASGSNANIPITVFETFTIAADNVDISTYEDKEIKITAYAIQADGLDLDEAWAAVGN